MIKKNMDSRIEFGKEERKHTLFSNFIMLLLQLMRPLLGPDDICPFTIGCTQYAMLQLQQQPLTKALKNILQRILACNPITNCFKKKSPIA